MKVKKMKSYNDDVRFNLLADYGAEDWFHEILDPVKEELTINGRIALEDLCDATSMTTVRIKRNLAHKDLEKYPRLYDFILLAYCAGYKLKLVPWSDQ